ncbi:extracellular solute-binding protein, partial [Cutibacterium acnes subsp. acnes]|nr:extracellular solute-binding protein [Cutibacterium acnes subsp. acnes]
APDTSAELVLAYWDKNQTRTIKENIKSFNKKYPNVKVTTNLAGYEDYWKKLRTQAQGNELPDVFWMNGPNIQLYAGNGMLAPI